MSPVQPNIAAPAHERTALTTAHEIGWMDEHGRPAPWPEDFFQADGTINPDWQPASNTPPENYNF